MGLFDDETSEKGEVRIGVSEGEDSRLREEVEEKVKDRGKKGSSDVTMKDLKRQNEKIINLLKKIVGDSGTSSNDSEGSHRVTQKKDNDPGGAMDELL